MSKNSASTQNPIRTVAARFPAYQVCLPIGGSLLALVTMLMIQHFT
jgi:hypothetical protein